MTNGVRRFLLGVLILGVTGIGIELLLIGHFDDPFQFVPLILIGGGLPALVALVVKPRPVAVRVVQALMALFVMSGGAGVVLHYRGNAAFELEMYPTLAGWALVRGTLTGATPVLAPGSMSLLGLVGLAVAYRYPIGHEAGRAGIHDDVELRRHGHEQSMDGGRAGRVRRGGGHVRGGAGVGAGRQGGDDR